MAAAQCWKLAGASLALMLGACNFVTGSIYIVVDDDGLIEGTGGASSGNGSGNGNSTTTSAGSGMPMDLADGVHVDSIVLYQGVERPLMTGGTAAASNIPIVANRDALLRVFCSTTADFNGQPVIGRLTIGAQAPLEASGTVGGTSTVEDLNSTINSAIPADYLNEPTSYRVEIMQGTADSSGQNAAAAYPSNGQTESLPVSSNGPQLKLVFVPISYGADGSNRLPDTSPGQIEIFRETFFKTYPVSAVDITISNSVAWNSTVAPSGMGWGSLLDAIISFRQQNGAAPDDYYYGIFRPSENINGFCGGGCVAGLSVQAGANDPMGRAGIGLGYSGQGSADTAIHEVGHEHGRLHAPCNVPSGIDNSYPYANGGIGVWGYDLLTQQLLSPSTHNDMMGYCDNNWVSDYTFKALFDRIKLVNNAAFMFPDGSLAKTYERIHIGADKTFEWLNPMVFETPPIGEVTPVSVRTFGGTVELSGHFYPYTHIPGGVLAFPQTATSVKRVIFERAGQGWSIGGPPSPPPQ